MTAVRPPATRRRPRPIDPPAVPYINRELSWLDFNARVLYEATDERNPLLERVRFLAIFASNLDEFFQVRVAGLKQQVAAGHSRPAPDGRSAAETLDRGPTQVLDLIVEHTLDLRQGPRATGRRRASASCRYDERPERHLELRRRFIDEIFPVLTPLAVDPGHPFPYISDLSLSLAVTVRDPETGERRLRAHQGAAGAAAPGRGRRAHLRAARADHRGQPRHALPGHGDRRAPPLPGHPQRRPLDRGGRGGRPAPGHRGGAAPAALRQGRAPRGRALDADRDAVAPAARPGRRTRRTSTRSPACSTCAPSRRSPTSTSPSSSRSLAAGRPGRGCCRTTRTRRPTSSPPSATGDLLVHHPYESFVGSVQRFIEQAASDPDVLTIKMTLYRTSGDSPIVQALIEAAESGKQVVVMVEIKARFDERANIVWARALERAGAHVAYGLVGLKTHSKARARRPPRGRRSAPLRPHRDRQLQPQDGAPLRRPGPADVRRRDRRRRDRPLQRPDRPLAPAPATAGCWWRRSACAPRIEELIDGRDRAPARARRRRASSSSSTPSSTRASSPPSTGPARPACRSTSSSARACARCGRASRASARRSAVRSIVGPLPRALAHPALRTAASGRRYCIGSADMMERNLDRRVEAVAPVLDPVSKARLDRILEVMLADDRRAWELGPDERWQRVEWRLEAPTGLDTFEAFKQEALVGRERRSAHDGQPGRGRAQVRRARSGGRRAAARRRPPGRPRGRAVGHASRSSIATSTPPTCASRRRAGTPGCGRPSRAPASTSSPSTTWPSSPRPAADRRARSLRRRIEWSGPATESLDPQRVARVGRPRAARGAGRRRARSRSASPSARPVGSASCAAPAAGRS